MQTKWTSDRPKTSHKVCKQVIDNVDGADKAQIVDVDKVSYGSCRQNI